MFKDYDFGFVHLDIKHLLKLRTANGEIRKRCLYVAIGHCSRWVHLAVKDDELATSAIAFRKEATARLPSRSRTCSPTAVRPLKLMAKVA
jgi:hypothetical protein